jgi:hypothetical protein
MSRLSQMFRRFKKTRVVEALVEYMETVDLPGPAKKAIVVAIMKMLHVKEGGAWDTEARQAIAGAIEMTLAEIREIARKSDPTPDDDPNRPNETQP